MEIRYSDKFLVIAPLTEKLDSYDIKKIANELSLESRKIGLDLNYACDCTIGFIEGLKNLCKTKDIGIFNIPSDIFAMFNFMKVDKSANLFVSELDFRENTRILVNRKFNLCKTSI